MIRSILFNWLASRYTNEIRGKIYEAAAEAARESLGADEDDPGTDTVERADVGLLFARSAEYGCLLDRLSNVRTTKGNGLKFTQARLGERRIAIVETGGGEDAAREGALALLQVFQPARVIAAGFAAALIPGIKRCSLFMPADLLASSGDRLDLRRLLLADETDSKPQRETDSADTQELDAKFGSAVLLTLNELPATPSERNRLAETFKAELADDTTFYAARVCRQASVPFIAIRAAATLADDLPPADLRLVAKAGKQSTARFLGALIGAATNRPSSLLDAYAIKERELTAADTLADALVSVIQGVK